MKCTTIFPGITLFIFGGLCGLVASIVSFVNWNRVQGNPNVDDTVKNDLLHMGIASLVLSIVSIILAVTMMMFTSEESRYIDAMKAGGRSARAAFRKSGGSEA